MTRKDYDRHGMTMGIFSGHFSVYVFSYKFEVHRKIVFTGTCRASEFLCANNRCIQNNWVGDGDNDCGDNSDETQGGHKEKKSMT